MIVKKSWSDGPTWDAEELNPVEKKMFCFTGGGGPSGGNSGPDNDGPGDNGGGGGSRPKPPPAAPVAPQGWNAQQYLTNNPDVAQNGMDPLEHYNKYGKSEGRSFAPSSQANFLNNTTVKNPAGSATSSEPGAAITDFLSEVQATEMRMGQRADADDGTPEDFLKSETDNALQKEIGSGSPMRGVSPFTADKRRGFLTKQGSGMMSEVPEGDAVVERQNDNPQATPGGEVGVGAQGFGARALTGGEGEVVANMAPPGAEQSETPVAQAQSDLQPDPNMPVPTPQAPLAPDVNYVLPTAGQSQLIAFSPNDPNAVFTARGPLSRNLISARTGFGRRFG